MMQKVILIISFILINSFINPSFSQRKQDNENSHISNEIKKLREYKELEKRRPWGTKIKINNYKSKNIVNVTISEFGENTKPSVLLYSIKYDKHLKKIIEVKKEN